ncbi:hypothetical protein OG520_44770 (plasmid) [Streptomyces sp. NBC_00984]|uniref:hypothetical protein n=1 Tax=Streptomyces sp. NBC_00984 TaxID=2903700 RepID=UPI002F908270|nr:hypothetical protein OG520_44770 [Streptomyces sp. NBC_00984]
MTTTAVAAKPEASKRRRKTRTKNVSHLPPIVASTLKTNEIDLTPGKEHLVCPNCSRWTPITDMLSTPKLVPHHTRRHRTTSPRRCSSSNRQVSINIAVTKWRTDLVQAAPTTASRRATKVLPKPVTTTPAAVHQLAATRAQRAASAEARLLPLLDRARSAHTAHHAMCMMCGSSGRCAEGRELEIALREVEATAVLTHEQQALRDRRAADQQRAARRESLKAALPKVARATRDRHNLPRPEARSKKTLVDEHELVRRTASWPAPMHGGPGLPLDHLHI